MTELVLYRKHRPKHFEEVVGQEHVVSAIQNALETGRIAHAYLFSGPRGVGKTTLARLIAKTLNCEGASKPCNKCQFCVEFNEGKAIDLIEIDAASNRGIDEIRELREGVRFAPSKGKFKCYIIDETHQLTKEAFNALLKTLEEPPAHAVFILATTELDKVPATIVSRTQHYDFRRPNVGQIANRLEQVAKKEKVSLEPEAAHLIAVVAEGSMRDAEGILGQIMAVEDREITLGEVERILGLPKREAVKKMFELIARKDTSSALSLIQEVADAGHDLASFSKMLLQYFRNALFLKTDPALKKFVQHEMLPDEIEVISANLTNYRTEDLSRGMELIFECLQGFKRSPIPQLPLELAVIDFIHGQEPQK